MTTQLLSHPQRFRVLGYALAGDKPAGSVLQLEPEGLSPTWGGRFPCPMLAEHLPTGSELRLLIQHLLPEAKLPPGRSISVVYEVIGEGYEYLHCRKCFPQRDDELIDERKAPGA